VLEFDDETIDEFIAAIVLKGSNEKRTNVHIGHTEFELPDTIIRKVYESVLSDMPETLPSKYSPKKQIKVEEELLVSTLEFNWQGLHAIIRDKKEHFVIKLNTLRGKI